MRQRLKRSVSQAIVWVDSGPIRRKRLGVYRRLKTSLEKARRDEAHYEHEDLPAFRSWLHRSFGAQLSRIREQQAEVEDKEGIVAEVRDLMWHGNLPPHVAYVRLMKQRQSDAEELDGDPHDDFDAFDEDDFEDFDPKAFMRDFADAFFNDAAGGTFPNDGREDEAREAFHGLFGLEDLGQAPLENNGTLKALYRGLAQRLHPDRCDSHDHESLEIWHELQEAYTARDLDWLRHVEAKCAIYEMHHPYETAISTINELIEETRAMLQSIRSYLRKVKNDLSWGFSELNEQSPERERAHAFLAADLNATEASLGEEMRHLDEIIATFSLVPKPRRKRPRMATQRTQKPGNPAKEKISEPKPEQMSFSF